MPFVDETVQTVGLLHLFAYRLQLHDVVVDMGYRYQFGPAGHAFAGVHVDDRGRPEGDDDTEKCTCEVGRHVVPPRFVDERSLHISVRSVPGAVRSMTILSGCRGCGERAECRLPATGLSRRPSAEKTACTGVSDGSTRPPDTSVSIPLSALLCGVVLSMFRHPPGRSGVPPRSAPSAGLLPGRHRILYR